MTRKPLLWVLLFSIPAALAAAPAAAPRKPTSPPTNSCPGCVERRPTLDPALFARGFDPEVMAGYEIARVYPATLDRIHCFCECAENPRFHHRTLLTLQSTTLSTSHHHRSKP